MTDAELEARARRACDQYERQFSNGIPWEKMNADQREYWIAIARAVLEEPPADPFEAWWEKHCSPTSIGKPLARDLWNASAAHEREECANIVADAIGKASGYEIHDMLAALAERIRNAS